MSVDGIVRQQTVDRTDRARVESQQWGEGERESIRWKARRQMHSAESLRRTFRNEESPTVDKGETVTAQTHEPVDLKQSRRLLCFQTACPSLPQPPNYTCYTSNCPKTELLLTLGRISQGEGKQRGCLGKRRGKKPSIACHCAHAAQIVGACTI